MNAYYIKLGEKLREIRESRKMTLVEVSEKIGIAFKTLANYETAQRKVPTPVLIALCNVYHYDVSVLFDESVAYLKEENL